MLEWIKQKLALRRKVKEMKRKFCDMYDELCGYLSGFVFEGKVWAKERALDSSKEYLHMINVRCGHADHIKSLIERNRELLIPAISKNKQDDVFDALLILFNILNDIMSFLTTCVNILPYSKLDDFYSYTYNARKAVIQYIHIQNIRKS